MDRSDILDDRPADLCDAGPGALRARTAYLGKAENAGRGHAGGPAGLVRSAVSRAALGRGLAKGGAQPANPSVAIPQLGFEPHIQRRAHECQIGLGPVPRRGRAFDRRIKP